MLNGQKMAVTAPLFAPYSVSDNTESRFISELLDDTDMGDNKGDSDGGEGDSDAEDMSSGEEDGADGKKRRHDDRPKTKDQIDRRRERNRVLARKTRLRKKFFFESLQRQVAQLAMENDMLKGIVKQRMGPETKDQVLANCASETNASVVAQTADQATSLLEKADLGLMAAIQAAQRSFIITDPALPDNPIIFASKGFLALSGYSLEDVLGRNCRFMQGPGTDQTHVETLRKGILAGEDTSVCLLNYRADGTQFYNQIFVAALRDANKKVINYVGVQVEVKTPLEPKGEGEESFLGLGKAVKKGRPRTRELKDKDLKTNSSSSSCSSSSSEANQRDVSPPKKSPRRSRSATRLNLPEMPERTSPTRQSARANKHVTQSSFGASSELAASLATFQQGWSQGGSQAMDDLFFLFDQDNGQDNGLDQGNFNFASSSSSGVGGTEDTNNWNF